MSVHVLIIWRTSAYSTCLNAVIPCPEYGLILIMVDKLVRINCCLRGNFLLGIWSQPSKYWKTAMHVNMLDVCRGSREVLTGYCSALMNSWDLLAAQRNLRWGPWDTMAWTGPPDLHPHAPPLPSRAARLPWPHSLFLPFLYILLMRKLQSILIPQSRKP